MHFKQFSGTHVDLFAGAGGMGLGFENFGFETVFVSELHRSALQTYLENRTGSGLSATKRHAQDIFDLTSDKLVLRNWAKFLIENHGEVDVLTGGPPCQGYSGIGHRRNYGTFKIAIPSNHLYKEMAKAIQALGPKIYFFENVAGLKTSRWSPEGEKGEIWRDVIDTFSEIRHKRRNKQLHYEVFPITVHAFDFGVPQNRPRVIIVGIRSDIFQSSGIKDVSLLDKFKLPFPSLVDAIGDLLDAGWENGGVTKFYPSQAVTAFQKASRTFPGSNTPRKKGQQVSDHEYSKHSPATLKRFETLIDSGGKLPESLKTKKFAQRLLKPNWGGASPNITVTSLPDDFVHYSQPRTLTVREWARLQTFPDWYVFQGPRTTGGVRRAGNPHENNWSRDLPKYTQIGNAVPVKLAEALAKFAIEVLKRSAAI